MTLHQALSRDGGQREQALDGLQGFDAIDGFVGAVFLLLPVRAVLVAVVDLGQGIAGVAGDQRHHILGRGRLPGLAGVAAFVGDGLAAQRDGPGFVGDEDVVQNQVVPEVQTGQVRQGAVKGLVQVQVEAVAGGDVQAEVVA